MTRLSRCASLGPLRHIGAAVLLLLLGDVTLAPLPAEARREVLTAEDKARLRQTERILLDILALTDQGAVEATGIAAVLTERLSALGYHVGTDAAQPHDASLRVKCEEHKTWEGTARSGGDADTPGGSSRLWRGPACQMSYKLPKLRSDWRHEVRGTAPSDVDSGDPTTPADRASAALAELGQQLRKDPFPFLLAAEWGQSDRLLRAVQQPDTEPAAKVILIGLLGQMGASDAVPSLGQSLRDPDIRVATAAAVAIGTIGGQEGVPLLLDVFTHGRPELHQAAARGLGRLAPLHPQTDIVPVLLERLPQASVPVQTEIIRALSSTFDRRCLPPLRALNQDIQANHATDRSPEMRALKEALGIALDQLDPTHGADE